MRALILSALLGATAAEAQISAADRDRLARFEESAGDAVLRAFAGGAPEDTAVLAEALSGSGGPPSLTGDWSCRTLKLGGRTTLEVFANFDCRIGILGPTEWRFEKLTGSERTVGTIALTDGRLIYTGAGYTGAAPAADYAALDQAGTDGTVPEIAVFEQMGPDRARLMFPYPLNGSGFEILYLTR